MSDDLVKRHGGVVMTKDEDGLEIMSGDYITFTFGIPPISVLCIVTSANGQLQIECLDPPDVKPRRDSLSNLMKWYQVWKAPKCRIAAYNRNSGRNTP